LGKINLIKNKLTQKKCLAAIASPISPRINAIFNSPTRVQSYKNKLRDENLK